eukprot:1219704-Amphidinium_carterae.1
MGFGPTCPSKKGNLDPVPRSFHAKLPRRHVAYTCNRHTAWTQRCLGSTRFASELQSEQKV